MTTGPLKLPVPLLSAVSCSGGTTYTMTEIFDGAAPISTWSAPSTSFSLSFTAPDPVIPTVFTAGQWDPQRSITYSLGSITAEPSSDLRPITGLVEPCYLPLRDWPRRIASMAVLLPSFTGVPSEAEVIYDFNGTDSSSIPANDVAVRRVSAKLQVDAANEVPYAFFLRTLF